MKIAYTVLVVLDVDPELDEPGYELRELTAQLGLARHELFREGAPEPGGRTIKVTTVPTCTTVVSAVELDGLS